MTPEQLDLLSEVWAAAIDARDSAQEALAKISELKQSLRESEIAALKSKLQAKGVDA